MGLASEGGEPQVLQGWLLGPWACVADQWLGVWGVL